MNVNKKIRKKLTCACDNCRKGKVKCDGNLPCSRCFKKNYSCNYSPQKKRGVTKKLTLSLPDSVGILFVGNPDLSVELLDIYMQYFHGFATNEIIDIKVILYPKTNADYYLQKIAFLYSLGSKEYTKECEDLENYIFVNMNNIIGNDLDILLVYTIFSKYCFTKSSKSYNFILTRARILLSKYQSKIQKDKKKFYLIYKISITLSCNYQYERNPEDNLLLDILQEELITVMNMDNDTVLEEYGIPKKKFQGLYELYGDPPYRVYFFNVYKLDDDDCLLSIPPWLTVTQKEVFLDKITSAIENLSVIGINLKTPFVIQLLTLLKCALLESINESQIDIVRKILLFFQENINQAKYAPYSVMSVLHYMFKFFLGYGEINEAYNVIEIQKEFSKFIPRLRDIAKSNYNRIQLLNTQNISSLFEKPKSLLSLCTEKLSPKIYHSDTPIILKGVHNIEKIQQLPQYFLQDNMII